MPRTDKYISHHFFEILSIIILVFFFLYTLGRANFAYIVHDEGALYMIIAKKSYWDIITFNGLSSANHLMNSLLAKFFQQFLKLSELSLRLPALIGHALYLIGVYKILKNFLNRKLMPFGAILMCGNLYILELFSLARGYALGLGFLILGVYFFLKGLKASNTDRSIQNFALSAWMAACAVLGHFVFLDVYLALLTMIVGYQLFRLITHKPFLKNVFSEVFIKLRVVWLSAFFLLITCALPILHIMGDQEYNMWMGGTGGFWLSTVSSLIWHSLYGQAYQTFPVVSVINLMLKILVFLPVGVLTVQWLVKRNIRLEDRYYLGVTALFLMTALVTIIEWHVFGTPFRAYRTGCYFIVLFMVTMVLLWQAGSSSNNSVLRIGTHCFFAGVVFILSIHFFKGANFNNVYIGRYGRSTDTAIRYLAQKYQNQQLKDKEITLGTHWIHLPAVHFYKAKYNLSWLKSPKDIAKFKEETLDYYYVTTDGNFLNNYGLKDDLLYLNTLDLKVVKLFPRSKHLLVAPAKSNGNL